MQFMVAQYSIGDNVCGIFCRYGVRFISLRDGAGALTIPRPDCQPTDCTDQPRKTLNRTRRYATLAWWRQT
jgi:hypothetical protein